MPKPDGREGWSYPLIPHRNGTPSADLVENIFHFDREKLVAVKGKTFPSLLLGFMLKRPGVPENAANNHAGIAARFGTSIAMAGM